MSALPEGRAAARGSVAELSEEPCAGSVSWEVSVPQILVDHSAGLDLDQAGFAEEVHRLIAEVIDTTVADCKTLFRPAGRHVVGDGRGGRAVVLVEVKILAGRSTAQRAELTARVLAALEARLDVPAAIGVEVTELDRETYRFVRHPGR
ncbi:5-carboxymethyl-2-hydroxymuconate Delta-isomerase [Kitasatospora sp. NPDC088160]|uniref:5-carboxymethyl-2-hydroxymuconate Delta-isomerase n=1 Tax=unclassified Kitasatospora TaxID=2633591 RepID=UPI003800E578